MTQLIGKDKLTQLRKDNYKFVLLYLLPTLAFAGVVTLLFLFSSRNLKSVFPIILSIVTTLYATYILFLSVIPFRTHLTYMNMCNATIYSTLFESDVRVTSIEDKVTTLRGVQCYAIHFEEIGEENLIIRFIPTEYRDLFVVDKAYKIRTHHQVIVAYEEYSDEKAQ